MKQITIIVLLSLVFSISANAQTKLSAEILKRIEDNTPKALPQTPVAPKLKSDAKDAGLKGKVKSVVEEREQLVGYGTDQGRRLSSITDFNEKGNFLKGVFFDVKGRPSSVMVYGYIDGMRVSKSKYITYDDDGPTIQIAKPNSKEEVKTEPDIRYSYRYEYKYIDGKLSEMQLFYNNGKKGIRSVYSYNENQMERLVYTEDGKLNQKYLTIFDKKGYEIEWTYFDIQQPKVYGDSKYSIKYDSFDKKGNWTKRTFLRLVVENEKEIYKPEFIKYRTITYYP